MHGHCREDSPVFLKGGAAAWVYLSQQCCLLPTSIKTTIGEIDSPSDLDFQSAKPPAAIIDGAKDAVIALGKNIACKWDSERWPQWKVRVDSDLGEAFFDHGQHSVGRIDGAVLPFKITYHAGLIEQGSLATFALVHFNRSVRSPKPSNPLDPSDATLQCKAVVGTTAPTCLYVLA